MVNLYSNFFNNLKNLSGNVQHSNFFSTNNLVKLF